jgi:glycosyltransferase involved in cell wall biosynthesis
MSRAASAPDPVAGLSVTIVCCNNEATIGRTLDSVRGLAGEIVAVDSGSTDGTLELLRDAGARIIHQPWLGFVAQKQFALEQCQGAWVLHLDSDESIDAAMAESIRAMIVRDDPAVAGGWCNRMTYYAGHPLRHAWQPEWRLRLVRRERAR